MQTLRINFPYFHQALGLQSTKGRRAIEKLDLLLLCLEALDISAPHVLSQYSQQIQSSSKFQNDVQIWTSRCHNPMRKFSRNTPIPQQSYESLLVLLSLMARRFYPDIRQLLSTKTPSSLKEKKWTDFSTRLDNLIYERMNIRRGAVKKYLYNSKESSLFYKKLLLTLALSSGSNGLQRLNSSLFDPI